MTTLNQLREVKILSHIKHDQASGVVGLGMRAEDLKKEYKPKSRTTFIGANKEKYHVTFTKGGNGWLNNPHSVFIHHEKDGVINHVGSIDGELYGRTFNTLYTGLHRDHVGHRIMTEAYKHLMLHHNLKLESSEEQSVGGNKIWKSLQGDNRFEITEPSLHKKTFSGRLKK